MIWLVRWVQGSRPCNSFAVPKLLIPTHMIDNVTNSPSKKQCKRLHFTKVTHPVQYAALPTQPPRPPGPLYRGPTMSRGLRLCRSKKPSGPCKPPSASFSLLRCQRSPHARPVPYATPPPCPVGCGSAAVKNRQALARPRPPGPLYRGSRRGPTVVRAVKVLQAAGL